MNTRGSVLPVCVAAIAGFFLWMATALIANKREPWDSPVFWMLAYPMAIAISALLGYWRPERPWRWVLALFAVQLVVMTLRSGEVGSLWPFGMVVLTILAIPGIVAAKIVAGFRAKSQRSR